MRIEIKDVTLPAINKDAQHRIAYMRNEKWYAMEWASNGQTADLYNYVNECVQVSADAEGSAVWRAINAAGEEAAEQPSRLLDPEIFNDSCEVLWDALHDIADYIDRFH